MQVEVACYTSTSALSKVKPDIEPVRVVHPVESSLKASRQVHHLIQLIGFDIAQAGHMSIHYHQGMTRRVGISIEDDEIILVPGDDEVFSVPRWSLVPKVAEYAFPFWRPITDVMEPPRSPEVFHSGVDQFLQFLAGLEVRDFFGRNEDLLSSLGITALARRTITQPEASKASQFDLFAPLQ